MEIILKEASNSFKAHSPATLIPIKPSWAAIGVTDAAKFSSLSWFLAGFPPTLIANLGAPPEGCADLDRYGPEHPLSQAIAEALIGLAFKPQARLSGWYVSHGIEEDAAKTKILTSLAVVAVVGGFVKMEQAAQTKWLDYRVTQSSTASLVLQALNAVPEGLLIGFSANITTTLEAASRFTASHGIPDKDVVIAKAILDYYKVDTGKWYQADQAKQRVGPAIYAKTQAILDKHSKISESSKAIDLAATTEDLNKIVAGEAHEVLSSAQAKTQLAESKKAAVNLARLADPNFPQAACEPNAEQVAACVHELHKSATALGYRKAMFSAEKFALLAAILLVLAAVLLKN